MVQGGPSIRVVLLLNFIPHLPSNADEKFAGSGARDSNGSRCFVKAKED
jgi:hypothetical protein